MAPPAKTTSRRGRRQGEPVSRDAVLRAAKQRFAEEGYEKTTLRAIANDAHVDPSMVLYLFGSKAELFRESLRLIIDPDVLAAALADGEGDIGTRMVRTYLEIWEHPDTAASMVALLAATNLVGTAILRYVMQVAPLAELPADDVVRLIAPSVTRYLTAPAEELGLSGL